MTVFDPFLAPSARHASRDSFPKLHPYDVQKDASSRQLSGYCASAKHAKFPNRAYDFADGSRDHQTNQEIAPNDIANNPAMTATFQIARAGTKRRSSCSSPDMSRGKLSCLTENACRNASDFKSSGMPFASGMGAPSTRTGKIGSLRSSADAISKRT